MRGKKSPRPRNVFFIPRPAGKCRWEKKMEKRLREREKEDGEAGESRGKGVKAFFFLYICIWFFSLFLNICFQSTVDLTLIFPPFFSHLYFPICLPAIHTDKELITLFAILSPSTFFGIDGVTTSPSIFSPTPSFYLMSAVVVLLLSFYRMDFPLRSSPLGV